MQTNDPACFVIIADTAVVTPLLELLRSQGVVARGGDSWKSLSSRKRGRAWMDAMGGDDDDDDDDGGGRGGGGDVVVVDVDDNDDNDDNDDDDVEGRADDDGGVNDSNSIYDDGSDGDIDRPDQEINQ
jgi:hypothetical protein